MNRPDPNAEAGALEQLLRRRRNVPPAGGAACGDPEILAAYAEGALDGEPLAGFEQHLAACAACRDVVVRLVRMAPREALALAEPARSRWAIGAWMKWAPALAVMVVAASVVFINREQVTEPPQRVALNMPTPPLSSEPQPVAGPAPASTTPPAPASKGQEAKPAEIPAVTMDKLAAANVPATTAANAPTPANIGPAAEDARRANERREGERDDARARTEARPSKDEGQQKVEFAAAPPPAPQAVGQMAQRQAAAAPPPAQAQQQQVAVLEDRAGGKAASGFRAAAGAEDSKKEALRVKTFLTRTWKVDDGSLMVSLDDGQSWRAVKTPEEVVSVTPEGDGMRLEITVRSGAAYRSTDGGRSFRRK